MCQKFSILSGEKHRDHHSDRYHHLVWSRTATLQLWRRITYCMLLHLDPMFMQSNCMTAKTGFSPLISRTKKTFALRFAVLFLLFFVPHFAMLISPVLFYAQKNSLCVLSFAVLFCLVLISRTKFSFGRRFTVLFFIVFTHAIFRPPQAPSTMQEDHEDCMKSHPAKTISFQFLFIFYCDDMRDLRCIRNVSLFFAVFGSQRSDDDLYSITSGSTILLPSMY